MGLKKTIKNLKSQCIYYLSSKYKSKRNREIIFILSTGRCGSTSITKMFNQVEKYIAFHEDMPQLIELSTELAHNPDRKNKIYKKLSALFDKRMYEGRKGQIVVHSDHRLWNLVEFLNDYFPNATYIHLMRNPLESVQSFLPRNWYSKNVAEEEKNIFEIHRIQGDKVGDMSSFEWNQLTRLEKCLWYWDYVNFTINHQLKNIPEKRKAIIKLETIEDDVKHFIEKTNVLGKQELKNVIINKSKKELIDYSEEYFNVAMSKFYRATNLFYEDYST